MEQVASLTQTIHIYSDRGSEFEVLGNLAGKSMLPKFQ